jgi:hypothetical protein
MHLFSRQKADGFNKTRRYWAILNVHRHRVDDARGLVGAPQSSKAGCST